MKSFLISCLLGTGALVANAGERVTAPVSLQLIPRPDDHPVPAEFVGLSFEMQRLLPDADGVHYFRPDNQPLLTLFQTVGVKSLRVGGNTADRPSVPFPSTVDIDTFFAFARAAHVKVIFTLRLREGNPRQAAAVAKHIVDHHADVLRCFAIGNEPNVFAPEYADFLKAWKNFTDVVNSPESAPAARFAGPSATAGKNFWTRDFARDLAGTGRLLVATQHIYPGGNAELVQDPAEGRRLMLSREWVEGYQKFHDGFVPGVRATGIPYWLGETNSFWNGGRADASNTFAAALWALDYQYWWALHGADGLNFHTGDFVARAEENTRCMYAVFWSTPHGYEAKPVAYALKAFSLGGAGKISPVTLADNPSNLNVTAYAAHTPDAIHLTLINKEFGPGARDAAIAVATQPGAIVAIIRLTTLENDIARTDGITLGSGSIAEDGTWNGQWTKLTPTDKTGRLVITVPAASAAIIKLPAP